MNYGGTLKSGGNGHEKIDTSPKIKKSIFYRNLKQLRYIYSVVYILENMKFKNDQNKLF